MNRMLILPGLVLAAACMTFAAADEPHVVQKQGPLAVSVTASLRNGRLEMSLSDSLLVTIRAEGAEGIQITAPATLTKAPAWKVRKELPANGRAQRTFELYPLAPGDQVLQLEPFQYRKEPGPWITVTWQPIPVTVTTQIVQADVKDLRGVTDIERLPPAPSWWDWGQWVLGGIGVSVLLIVGLRMWRRRRRFAATLSPEQAAGRELDRILGLNLPAAGEVERFHTLLANIVRRYLENRFALPARRQTTPEFLQAMEESPILSAEQQSLLRNFLERCDLAKFARARPDEEECVATAAMARELVVGAGQREIS